MLLAVDTSCNLVWSADVGAQIFGSVAASRSPGDHTSTQLGITKVVDLGATGSIAVGQLDVFDLAPGGAHVRDGAALRLAQDVSERAAECGGGDDGVVVLHLDAASRHLHAHDVTVDLDGCLVASLGPAFHRPAADAERARLANEDGAQLH